jgi:hypothetical protein
MAEVVAVSTSRPQSAPKVNAVVVPLRQTGQPVDAPAFVCFSAIERRQDAEREDFGKTTRG